MGGRCAVAAAVCVWMGVVCGATAGSAWGWTALGVALALGLLAARAPDRTGSVALLLALALAGSARGSAHRRRIEAGRVLIPPAGAPSWIVARLVEPPPRESGEPTAIVSLERSRPALPAGARVRLRFPAGAALEWGDRVRVLATLEAPESARNPGGYDGRAAADASAVIASGRALVVERLRGDPLRRWPRATASRWRRAIEARIHRGLTPRARELVVPLVIGDRSALPTELNAQLRAAGLIHLLALSGLHVVWLASVARGMCAALGCGPAVRAIAGAACAALYAGIAGPLPSLMRAAVTEALVAVARLLGRAIDPVQALGLGAIALLAVAPGWARDVGFQLSCAATLGLVTIGPWMNDRAGRLRAPASLLIPTLVAQVTAFPILLASFHAVSWVGSLANLAAVPVCGVLLIAAWLGVALDVALPGCAGLVFGACEVLAGALRAITSVAARMPAALIGAGAEPGVAACAAVGAVLLAMALPGDRSLDAPLRGPRGGRSIAAILGVFACALAAVLVATVRPLSPPTGRAWLVVLDVGQGDALALGFEDGWWLVDAGPKQPRFDAGESIVAPFLRWAGVRRLEGLILTHDDGDHTGGAAAVQRAVPVRRMLAAPALDGAPGPGARFGASEVERGETLHVCPPLIVRWPPGSRAIARDAAGWSPHRTLTSPDNAAGVVLEMGSGDGRAVLLADVDSLVEPLLHLERGAAVLKVGHHGSASSTGAGFVRPLAPRIAVIPVGRRNRFGHPAPAVLDRLRACGVPVHRTDLEGALWFELGPDGTRIVSWRDGAPSRSPEPHLILPRRFE